MSNEKKKLYLEDYDNNFNYLKKKSNINISFNRAAFIFILFSMVGMIFATKLVYLGFLYKDVEPKALSKSDFRATILDRDGNIIAKSVVTTNVGINPKLVINKKKLLINLKLIFPNENFDQIHRKLNKEKFFYLKKKINYEKFEKLTLLGDKSIIFENKISRIYPHGRLFSHILGQIDEDNNGISGIEKKFDYELRTSKENLSLTIDTDIQFLIREELIKAKKIFNYIGSAAILINVNNGEIISMVSQPDFDLNKREEIIDKKYINRATKGLYEFGSVFKTFTFTAALNEKLIEPDTKFLDLEKKLKCGKNTISEYDDKIPSDLTAEEILIRSGNIGSVRIAQKLGIEKFNSFLTQIGIINKIIFDIEEIGEPLPFNWGKCKLATASFGHGITTTLLQLAKAYSIITNGGYNINPTLLIKDKYNYSDRKRILNQGISDKVNLILRKIVSTKEGTAEFANVKGYEVGGKTGTAQKTTLGGYKKARVNTFVSVFPTSKPKFVLVVLLDEPKANKEYVYKYRDGRSPYKGNWRNTAGWTTVEVVGRIIDTIGPILATKY